jgi:hypothetical protein
VATIVKIKCTLFYNMKIHPSRQSVFFKSLTSLTVLALAGEISFGATAAQAVKFNFVPEQGTSQQAINGFTAAGKLWSDNFTDDITVNIDIAFKSLEPGVLGETSLETIGSRYSTVRDALNEDKQSTDDATAVANLQTGAALNFLTTNPFTGNTIRDNNSTTNNVALDVNRANAKALGLLSSNNTSTDASITFNSDFTFDFDRSNGINSDAYDFVGVAAHEIGHALGFSSGVDTVDYFSEPNGPGAPLSLQNYRVFTPLDLFRFSDASKAQGVPDLAAGSNAYFSIDKGQTNLGQFSTGVYNGDGRQASHWKDALDLGIMDPTAANGEVLKISGLDLRAFDVIGWNLADGAMDRALSENSAGSPDSQATTPNNLAADINIGQPVGGNPASVPEPSTLAGLIALGAGFFWLKRSKRSCN